MTPDEERKLVEEVRRNPEAFGRIFDAHFRGVFRYLLLRTADAGLAEELTSRTFFKALRGMKRFRSERGRLSTWLLRIAENEVRDWMRRRRRRREARLPGDGALAWDGRGPEEEAAAAEEAVARAGEFRLVHQCLASLKPLDQALVVLRYFEGRSFGEIARILGRREGALRMRNLRALRRLKGMLLERGFGHGGILEGSGGTTARSGTAPAGGAGLRGETPFPAP